MHQASTYTQQDITEQERESGLVFAGFMRMDADAGAEQVTTLIPVLLRQDRSREEQLAKIRQLNRG